MVVIIMLGIYDWWERSFRLIILGMKSLGNVYVKLYESKECG